MQVWRMTDSDNCSEALVIAVDLLSAIDLYFNKFKYYPEIIKELTADNELVILQKE